MGLTQEQIGRLKAWSQPHERSETPKLEEAIRAALSTIEEKAAHIALIDQKLALALQQLDDAKATLANERSLSNTHEVRWQAREAKLREALSRLQARVASTNPGPFSLGELVLDEIRHMLATSPAPQGEPAGRTEGEER